MKAIAVFLIFAFTGAFGHKVQLREGIVPQKLTPIQFSHDILPQKSWEHIKDIVLSRGELKGGFVQAHVTEHVLEVMADLQKLIVRLGYDPLALSNQTIKLYPTGSIELTNGFLTDASTISVSDLVTARYYIDNKILEIVLPISFKSLQIKYDYHTEMTPVIGFGDVDAEIKNFTLNLAFGFDFNSHHAFVDEANVIDSGSISFKFTGLFYDIPDIASETFTTLFQGISLSVVNLILVSPLQFIVRAINDLIDQLLENSVAAAFTY